MLCEEIIVVSCFVHLATLDVLSKLAGSMGLYVVLQPINVKFIGIQHHVLFLSEEL